MKKDQFIKRWISSSSYWNTQIEAKAFADAAGITDKTQQLALAVFVNDLKAINAVQADFVNFVTPENSVLKAVYPLMGSTANSQKYNLIDPRDLDAAYRLVFLNDTEAVHTNAGYKPNGINQAADTKFNPAVKLALNDTHIGCYTSEDTEGGGYSGCYSAAGRYFMYSKLSAAAAVQFYTSGSANLYSTYVDSSIGFTLGSRLTDAISSLFKNGKKLKGNTTSVGALPSLNVWFGGVNHATTPRYQAGNVSYGSIGKGISDAANVLYWIAVKKLMIAIGRRTADSVRVKSGVCFEFDDNANVSNWVAFPWLAAMNDVKVSFALYGNSFTGALLEEGQKAVINGGAIIGHTLNHTQYVNYIAVPHTDQEYYDNEVSPNLVAIQAAFGNTYKVFTYPVGTYSSNCDSILLADGVSHIIHNNGGYSYYYDGTKQAMFYYNLANQTYDIDIIKGLIDTALSQNKILCFISHYIGITNDLQAITFARMKEVVDYVNSKNMSFYNNSELLPTVFS